VDLACPLAPVRPHTWPRKTTISSPSNHDQFPIYGTQDHGMVSTMGLVIAGSETSAVVSGAV
jgi:hypothetical protein